MTEKRFTTKGIIISHYGVWDTDDKPYANDDVVDLLNEQQATIDNQEQRIKILQQEINDTQAILEMLTEKLKGWNDE